MPPMKGDTHYLAIDLGASSGRGVVGSFDGERLTLREVHRFENGPVKRATGLHWDSRRIFANVKKCLVRARERGFELDGVGIDTWGVDYGLLSAFGELLGPPRHYRDVRTAGAFALDPGRTGSTTRSANPKNSVYYYTEQCYSDQSIQ